MVSLFDLTEFTVYKTYEKLFADDQFEMLAKELQKTFDACREMLRQAALCQRAEVSAAFDSLSKIERQITKEMKPVLAAFQGLQDSLDLGRNQRILPDLAGGVAPWLKRIEKLSEVTVIQPAVEPVIQKEAELKSLLASSVSRKLRRKSKRSERPRLIEPAFSSHYRETNIGYLAILEQLNDSSGLLECDDDEL